MTQLQLKPRRRERTCMHPGGCDWRVRSLDVLCPIHIAKIQAELAARLTGAWRHGCINYGFGRTTRFDRAWSEAKKILEGKR